MSDVDTLESGGVMFGGDTDYDAVDSDSDLGNKSTIGAMFRDFGNELSNGLIDDDEPQPPRVTQAVAAPDIVILSASNEQSSLRRRHPPPQRAPPPPPSAPKATGPSWLKRRFMDVNERYELWRISLAERWSPRLERCYRARYRLVCAFCGLVALILIIVVATTTLWSNPHAYVKTEYVRHGHNDVNLSAPSDALTCSEMTSNVISRPRAHEETSLERIRSIAESLVIRDNLECVCGPMFGVWRRYIALRLWNESVMHMYNPVLDGEWRGELDDGAYLNVSEWLVVENQRMLFPGREHDVNVVRRSAIRVAFRDVGCSASAIVVQNERACCVQACLDLLDGVSVYDAAWLPGDEEEEEEQHQ